MTLISGYRKFPVVVRRFGEIIELIKDERNKPNYLFGPPVDIISKLADLSKSANYAQTKFPLIALFQEFDENVTDAGVEVSLNVIIANTTKHNYRSEDRYRHNFEPILYPILEQFERALKVSKTVELLDNNYTKTDKVYWGKNGIYGSEGNIFNDYIDAIEIKNLNLKFKNNCK